MPQAVQPGSYANLYAQQLQQTILTMASNPSTALAMYSSSPMMTQADSMIDSSMESIDSQLATVGISITPGAAASAIPAGSNAGLMGLGGGSMPGGMTGGLGGSSLLGGMTGGLGGSSLLGAMNAGTGQPTSLSAAIPMLLQMFAMLMSMTKGKTGATPGLQGNIFSGQTLPQSSLGLSSSPFNQLSTFA